MGSIRRGRAAISCRYQPGRRILRAQQRGAWSAINAGELAEGIRTGRDHPLQRVPRHRDFRDPAPGFSTGQAMQAVSENAIIACRAVGFAWDGISYHNPSLAAARAVFALLIVLVFLILAALYEAGRCRSAYFSCRSRYAAPSQDCGRAISTMTCTRKSASSCWSACLPKTPSLTVNLPEPSWKGRILN